MFEVKLPQQGQSVEEASIVEWKKKEGDTVKAGDALFTIQTDKAEIECESPASGVLRKILVEPDVTVPVLTVVALIGDANEALPEIAESAAAPVAAPAVAEVAPVVAEANAPAAEVAAPREGGRIFASPRAKALAEKLGVDLAAVAGSGAEGRIVEADVEAAAANAPNATPVARRIAEQQGVSLAGVSGTGIGGKITKDDVLSAAINAPVAAGTPTPGAKRVALTPMRRIIARRMVESLTSAPHYFVTIEVDMAAAVAYRKSETAFKPSFNDMVLFAVTKGLLEFPAVNARWCGDYIEELADVNLGFAVALPAGLVVPVVKQAQNKSLRGIHEDSKALVEKARNNKLTPDDYSGNTFTISNLGGFGVDHFTAIINQPDSAILAVGQIKDRPVVVDGGIFIRPIMKMTLSSDHRVIDGALAAQFMGRLKEIMEKAEF